MRNSNIHPTDSLNKLTPQYGRRQAVKALLATLAAGVILPATAAIAHVQGKDACQAGNDPATDSAEWQLFNDLLAPILAFRAYVIEGERPLDPARLMALHDEASANAYDLHGVMTTGSFERGILIACCDPVEYERVLNQKYPDLHVRPSEEPAIQAAPEPELSPIQTREWWLDTAAKMQRLADEARQMAEAA